MGLQWSKCTGAVDHVFGETISKFSNTYNLFIWYPNSMHFSAMKSS
jgi:hypothetical protein